MGMTALDKTEFEDANGRYYFGLTPLMKAAARGYTEAIQMLLDNGAEINLKDNMGMTALDKTEYGDNDYKESAALLRSKGAIEGDPQPPPPKRSEEDLKMEEEINEIRAKWAAEEAAEGAQATEVAG